jgi:kinesin family protein 3/17
MLSHKSESVKVLIRCRPFNQKEIINHCIKCIDIQPIDQNKNSHQCIIKLISPKKYRRRISRLFRFDSIYDENHRTEHIFQDFVQSLVSDVTLNGYSGTVFAYGQTGSGSRIDLDLNIKIYRICRKILDNDRLSMSFRKWIDCKCD